LTEGIDFYAGFTIKHQSRKYFHFGDLLAPEYRARMLRGEKKLDERRPHETTASLGTSPIGRNEEEHQSER